MSEEIAAADVSEREKLASAVEAEKKARAAKVLELIHQICKEHNCKFAANPVLVEQPSGGFVISANPGIVAL